MDLCVRDQNKNKTVNVLPVCYIVGMQQISSRERVQCDDVFVCVCCCLVQIERIELKEKNDSHAEEEN